MPTYEPVSYPPRDSETKRIFNSIPYELLNDPKLSFKAKGLFLYMLSKPAGYDFASKRIAWETRESVDAIQAGLKELRTLGYIQSKRVRVGDLPQPVSYLIK